MNVTAPHFSEGAGIADILTLEKIDPGLYRGPVIPSLLTRTFGGQVAAQALSAAVDSVDPECALHSLHGYFVGPGDSTKPTIFHVDTVRDGRSFRSRQVTAVQNGEAIFIMNCSFHRRGDLGLEHSDEIPDVPKPHDIPVDYDALPESAQTLLKSWTEWDFRIVNTADYDGRTHARQLVWFKSKKRLPDIEHFHQCTLAYMSDMTLLYTALVPHPGAEIQMASLDHAIWFLRPFRADEWLLYDQITPSAHAGRALTHGRVFNETGDLVAIVTQEGLTRNRAKGVSILPMTQANPATT
ncbi:acyl-CoA thioesterase II [Corynebacterium felinum]|uniref:Acyl-CoA thioesterase-2 n=1 Tax=Corynebacterium felinum TaxID=131318 RepID=A0ABU2BB11_9CORY|nr:acyl-CoA thioesterase II [Corynebacterium felinum]MDF5821387.1 acyl-CoA thioesterase II [Corynebacterium felinum]MDR7355812.1 acyl-CoA thioesterase-2 [Corynebacterium felinum]WJY95157.1 Acyl-CoA thioesterase 2 [Corynebacterium felinum]